MPTTILGQYIGFWFGTLSAICFLLVFLTCRIFGGTKLYAIFRNYWDAVHKWAWNFGIIFVLIHITLITLGFVFGIWM